MAATDSTDGSRVCGLETEYGVTPSWRGHARRLVAALQQGRAVGGFATNGARLYLDAGDHPEVATPECADALTAAAHDHAGELLLARAARDLAAATADDPAAAGDPPLRVLRNNLDADGTTYGTHENYQVARQLTPDPVRLAHRLASTLAARPLLCGAGTIHVDGTGRARFLTSQRANVTLEVASTASTRDRPMVLLRDEPLARTALWRRLQVTCGDATMNHTSTWHKLALARAVVAVLEVSPGALDHLELTDPIGAMRCWAADPATPVLAADGTRWTAATLLGAVVDVLDRHATSAAELVGDDVVDAASHTVALLDRWDADGPGGLSRHVDWAAKNQLLEAVARRHGTVGPDEPLGPDQLAGPRLRALDLLFHDIVAGPAVQLRRRGRVDQLFDDAELDHHSRVAPAGRAETRGQVVVEVLGADAADAVTVTWDRVLVPAASGDGRDLTCMDDPRRAEPDVVAAVHRAVRRRHTGRSLSVPA